MPKIPMDYSNTIFYKIYCIDPSINELYIGHTTNFVQRKHAHKQGCNNVKSANYKCKLYQAMRENSGWDNWKMDIIAFHECDNLLGAKIQEQKYYEEYKATLNSIEPLPKPKPKIVKDVVKKEKCIFYCNKCNIHFDSSKTQDVHNTTRKHIKNSAIDNGEIETAEKCQIYHCTFCDIKCYKHSNYTTHLSTRKHKLMTNSDCKMLKNAKEYICLCGKKYKFRQGLSLHKKTCTYIEESLTNNEEHITQNNSNETNSKTTGVETDKELLIKMLLKNQEIMEKLIETMPNIGNNSHDLSSK